MAEYLSWSRLFESGGPTLLILLICSIVSFVVIIERFVYFNAKRVSVVDFLAKFLERLGNAGVLHPRDEEDYRKTPVGYVLVECHESVRERADGEDFDRRFDETKSRAIAEKLPDMDRYLGIVATLGTVSPYIGLLGTVFGIIRAFMSLGGDPSAESAASMNELNAGIAEALIATAAGLFVAIPATIAYNFFRRRANALVLDMEIAASRLKSALLANRKG